MLNTLDYSQVPSDFVHCFKKDCRLADHCLRYQVTPFIPRERWSVSVINPSIAGTGDDCQSPGGAICHARTLREKPFLPLKKKRPLLRPEGAAICK